MTERLLNLLTRIDAPGLERLAGTTIVRATSGIIDTDRVRGLAELVLLKFGREILHSREIRDRLIYTLQPNEAERHCNYVGIPTNGDAYGALISYFHNNSSEKSQYFINAFSLDLPDDFVYRTLKDPRTERETIRNTQGQESTRHYLHPYQKIIKDRALDKILSRQSRFMIHMPTGAGKTATALELAVDIFRTPHQKKYITWLVNNETLAEQAFTTFKELWGQKGDQQLDGLRFFGKFEPQFRENEIAFVCATFQKFHRALDPTHPNAKNIEKLISNTSLLIVDEAHTSMARTFFETIYKFVSTERPSQLVGLSATPAHQESNENTVLNNFYGGTLIGIDTEGDLNPIKFLQEGKFLAPLHHFPIDTQIDNMEQDEDLACDALAENPARNQLIINQMRDAIHKNEPSLIFACNKDHVFVINALARHAGIKTGVIVGETSSSERERILGDFRSGDLQFIVNYNILATGVDVPNVRRIIITRPVGSAILYSQIIGRALRGKLNGGSGQTNTIVSLRDNINVFSNESVLFENFYQNFFN